MSKPKMIDLTGNLSRLRQIALNHAVEAVAPHRQGAVAADELITCAGRLLKWLREEHGVETQNGDGARYGIPATNGQAAVTPCVAWFTDLPTAKAFRAVWTCSAA